MNTTNTNKKPLTRNKSLNISNDPLLTKKTKTENLGQQKQMPLILIPPSTVNARTDCQPTPHPVPSSPPSSQWLSDTTWHYCSPLLMRKRTNHRKKRSGSNKNKTKQLFDVIMTTKHRRTGQQWCLVNLVQSERINPKWMWECMGSPTDD